MQMYLTLLKKSKIPINNTCVTIKAIVIVKKFPRKLLISLSGNSIFAFGITKYIFELNFDFPNTWSLIIQLIF